MKSGLKKSFLAMAAFAMAMTACNSNSSDNSDESGNEGSVKSFPVSMSIKSAQQCYSISDSLNECDVYLTLSTSVQWPEKLGNYDLTALKDTIVTRLYNMRSAGKGIDEMMTAYVGDAASYDLGSKITRIDSVPSVSAFNNEYYSQSDMSVMELNEDMVTINIAFEMYMGGAHPNWGSFPFTYDLKAGKVVTPGYLFKPGYESSLVALLKETVASQLNISVSQLESSMLTTEMPVSNCVFIRDGDIVFHYNPYEFLPYSFGAVDAAISVYSVQDILTPAAQKLLD